MTVLSRLSTCRGESLKALEEATPRRITFDELDFNFGERWIPTGIYSAYASNLYATDVKIMYSPSMDEYSVKAQQKNMKIWEGVLRERILPLIRWHEPS